MQRLFEEGTQTDFAGMKHDVHQTFEAGHGRHEEQTCHVIEVPRDHPQRTRWKDLRTLVVTVLRHTVERKDSWELLLSLSSHPPRAQRLAHAIRRHWSIENSQHWVLDVSFGVEPVGKRAERRRSPPTGPPRCRQPRRRETLDTQPTPPGAAPNANAWPALLTPITCSKSFTHPNSMRKPWVRHIDGPGHVHELSSFCFQHEPLSSPE